MASSILDVSVKSLTFAKIMDQNQHESRQAAAQDFMKSLKQLEGIVQEDPEKSEVSKSPQPSSPSIELSAFEQAAADIEEFMRGQE